MNATLVRGVRAELADSGPYLLLWVVGIASALVAGREPGYWWDPQKPWPYPWAQTLITLAAVTTEVIALRVWLGPRSRTTALWRWLVATAVFVPIGVWLAFHRVTDQPGWFYARTQLAGLIALGLMVRLCYELLRRAVRCVWRARKNPGI